MGGRFNGTDHRPGRPCLFNGALNVNYNYSYNYNYNYNYYNRSLVNYIVRELERETMAMFATGLY